MDFQLPAEKHAKYFKRVLGVLPAAYQGEDSNRIAIIYFALNGLSVLGKLDEFIRPDERQHWIDSIYDQYLVPSGEGFRGSPLYKLDSSVGSNCYDPPSLAATFFALNVLFLLGDSDVPTRIDRKKIMDYVSRCQLPTGEFCTVLGADGKPFGDTDMRYDMIAATIRLFLQWPRDIDLDSLETAILSSISYDGGIGGAAYQESHSGLTFCGLSTLKLIKRLDSHNWDKTLHFLVQRQIREFEGTEREYEFNDDDDFGGFNGRANKYGDTCYTFWNLGSLKLLTDKTLYDPDALLQFLSRTQNELLGGFNKGTDPDERPDPFHSFLGLVTLSLLNEQSTFSKQLKRVNVEYMLADDVVEFIESLQWGEKR